MLPFSAKSQDYHRVDSLMRTYKEKIKSADDLYKVVYYIRKNFQEDSIRLRASFIWITENITYDVKAFQRDDPNAAQLSYVIKHKKAICLGYASLLKYFCDAFSIECFVVDGFARTGKRGVVLNQGGLRSNHAWNAIKINNQWRLLDPTWAAGALDESDEENLVWRKGFNELYYFTAPERFILNHFPRQNRFQLVNTLVHEINFKKAPLYTSEFIGDSIQRVFPDTALIRGKTGDTLVFKFKTSGPMTKMCVWSDVVKKASYTDYVMRKEEWVEFHYPVKVIGTYTIYVGSCSIAQSSALLAYKLEIK